MNKIDREQQQGQTITQEPPQFRPLVVAVQICQPQLQAQNQLPFIYPVYTQRQLKVFTEDRAKLMSEDRIRRGSSQQLQRAHHFHNSEAEDRAEKQKLKHTLGKINLLADGAIEVT